MKKRGYAHKMAALSLVERGGEIRSFAIDKADAANIWPIIDKNLSWESTLMTDDPAVYGTIGREFKAHFKVDHGKGEYVRGDAHTNTLESYFSAFKRGMKAFINIAMRSICTAILRNSTSVTIIGLPRA